MLGEPASSFTGKKVMLAAFPGHYELLVMQGPFLSLLTGGLAQESALVPGKPTTRFDYSGLLLAAHTGHHETLVEGVAVFGVLTVVFL